MQFVVLGILLGVIIIQTFAFAIYIRRLAKRLKKLSPQLYKQIMPKGWFLSSFSRKNLTKIYEVADRLQASDDASLQREGRNLNTIKNIIFVLDIVLVALMLKALIRLV